jgi:anti-repressor protein
MSNIVIDNNGTSHVKDDIDYSLITPLTNGRVNARNLYKFLGLNQSAITRWFNTNIVNDDLVTEGEDYWGFNIVLNGNSTMDFELTVDFAKELCMLARNEKGKKARKYFIEMERIAKERNKPLTIEDILQLNIDTIKTLKQENLKLQAENVLMSSRDLEVKTQKDYKWKNQVVQADRGRTINYYVSKLFFQGDYRQAHNQAKLAYKRSTGISLPQNISYASSEQKKDYLNWLSQQDGLIIDETNIYI